jgi:methionyl-tRNA formyltransferase
VNTLLVAEESAGLQTLRMLLEIGHRVVAVLTSADSSSRGATVASLAHRSGVPVLRSDLVGDRAFAEWIEEREIELLLNIHSLFVIHGDVVAAPTIGSFNLHPGPLPHYAGLNAPSWAIYNGERTHAVTLHWMEPGIDTGPVAYTEEFAVEAEETGLSLSMKCIQLALPLVRALLEKAEQDPASIPVLPQDLSKRRYFGREPPQEGRIRWARSAEEIVRFVRASDFAPFPSPWGHPLATADRKSVGIAKAALTGEPTNDPAGTVAASKTGEIRVAAGDEWVRVLRLEVDGRYEHAADVLAPGTRLGDG